MREGECCYYGCERFAEATIRWVGSDEKPYCQKHAEKALEDFPKSTEAV